MGTRIHKHTREVAGLVALVLAAGAAWAADVVGVYPVARDILVVIYDEGHTDYNGIPRDGDYKTGPFEGQNKNNVIYHSLLNTTAAANVSNYTITSPDDPQYVAGRNPTHIGYKAKGVDFNPGDSPEYLREYRYYLLLPDGLTEGRTYTVGLNGLADNRKEYRFVFDKFSIYSPSIHVNQEGFLPDATKYAYLQQWMGPHNYGGAHPSGGLDLSAYEGKSFYLYDVNTKSVAFTGTISKQNVVCDSYKVPENKVCNNWSGSDVWQCDFSSFTTPGEYVLAVDDMGCSYRFRIADDVYWDAFYAAMRGLYYARQGIVKRADEFGGKVYPRSQHYEDVQYYYDPSSVDYNHDLNGFDFSSRPIDGIYGHYYDAGDWDYYGGSHWKVPITIMLTYAINPTAFSDGDIGNVYKLAESDPSWIEEAGNGLPDILDEAQWMCDFGKRTIDALKAAGYGTGGMSVYVGREAGATGKPSWGDDRDMAVKGEHYEVTFNYAGAAAFFARCLNIFHQDVQGNTGDHPDYAAWKTEAEDAYNWAVSNGGGGTSSEKEIAAAALFSITGDVSYENTFHECFSVDPQKGHGTWVAPNNITLATAIYALTCTDIADATKYAEVSELVQRKANGMLNSNGYKTEERGFRFGGLEGWWQWQPMNIMTIPRTIPQAISYELSGDRAYLDDVLHTNDYILGGNNQNMAKMSGIGDHAEFAAFVPDAWYLLDYNSKVYRNPIFAGNSCYNRGNFDVNGPGNEGWAEQSAIPAKADWPQGERRWFSRYSIAGSEFTIHQNNLWYIFSFGYLLKTNPDFAPNARPTVSLNLTEGQDIGYDCTQLEVTASADVALVEYYYDWHYIGQSIDKAGAFPIRWNLSQTGLQVGETVEITAVAYDDRGLSTLPGDDADKTVTIVAGGECVSPVTPPAAPPATSPRRIGIHTSNRTVVVTLGHTRAEQASAAVYTAGGRMVGRLQRDGRRLSWSAPCTGVWLVRVQTGDGTLVKRVVVR